MKVDLPRPDLSHSRPWGEIMAFYRFLKPSLWLMRLPLLGPVLQKKLIKPQMDANWFIPVGEAVPAGVRSVLPRLVIAYLLGQADGIFAMHACPCRTAFKCQEHNTEIGCLHIGPTARRIPAELGRPLSLDEGLAYLDAALADGLLPTILHIPNEAVIFGVEKTRMLSICFCCECCCDVRLMLRDGPNRYWDEYNHRLPGVQVVVSQACTLCGTCVSTCYGGERVISLGPVKAEIHERCIGCGRCVEACPEGAISLAFDPHTDVLAALLERIESRVEITG
jgi:NAD-dependent dihydropyrimidine dehydrogenase PreA subunit